MGKRLFIMALGLAAGLAGGRAAAQQLVALVGRDAGRGPAAVTELIAALEVRLDTAPGLMAVVPVVPQPPAAAAAAAERARGHLKRAREHHRQFDGPAALAALAAAAAELQGGCAGADRTLLRALRLLEGRIHFAAGRRAAARRAFGRLAAIAPQWRPDARELAPKVVACIAEARRRSAERSPAQLALTGQPAGAEVRLDGAVVGELPLVQTGLVPGRHCLQLAAPGYGIWAMQLTATAGAALRQRVDLLPQRVRPLLRPGRGPPPGARAAEWVRAFEVDWLAWLDVGPDGVALGLAAAGDGRRRGPLRCAWPTGQPPPLECLGSALLGARRELAAPPPGAAGALSRALGPDSASAEPADPADPAPAATPWYRRWWVWTAAAAVAAGVGLGVGLGLGLDAGAGGGRYRVVLTRPGG